MLAIDGGKPVRPEPLPMRGLIGQEEKRIVMQLFDESISSGRAFGCDGQNRFGYNGLYEQGYEKAFVEYMGGGFADGVNSGTNAIFCALGALQLEPLSEVIVPPITDPGGVMPVLFLGCVPVFADSAPNTYNTSAQQIEKVITERTRAIIVAHIAGDPADMDPIMELAKKHDLYVIEDCAQAHGAEYKGKKVGTIGDIAAFSTMMGKHHCTGGQGGVVYSTDEKLHWQGRRFADRGKPLNIENEIGNVVAGINCNLNDIAAAIGIVQLEKLPKMLENRRSISDMIKKHLSDSKTVSLGSEVSDTKSARWFLKFKLDIDALSVDKAKFCEALRREVEGLEVITSYRHINCEKPWFRNQAVFGKSGYPWQAPEYKGDRNPTFDMSNAIAVSDTHFSIIIYESNSVADAKDIATAIKKVEKAYMKEEILS